MRGSTLHDRAHHLLVYVRQGTVRGYNIVDVRKNYGPAVTELGARAVAAAPNLAGREWFPTLRVEAGADDHGRVLLEAYLESPLNVDDVILATIEIPVENLTWMAEGIAAKLRLDGRYSYGVQVLDPDDPLIQAAAASDEDGNFEFDDCGSTLILPRGFHVGEPPFPRQIIAPAPTWLRCVFFRGALSQFLGAAAKETHSERGWAGIGSVYLTSAACYVVIEQLLELPVADAGRSFIHTRGRDFLKLRQQVGGNLTSYLHLHPAEIKGRRIPPFPSNSDAVLAWNFDLASEFPCVYPIALFGIDPKVPAGDFAVHGYDHGILTRVQAEASTDD